MSTQLNGSLLKGFEILRLITHDRSEITASIVKSELGMNFATAHRFLATLEEAGALISLRRGAYQLGPACAEMGRLAEANNPFGHHARPVLDKARDTLQESLMICRMRRTGPACVSVTHCDRSITVNISVGTTLPFYNSAHGKLWLASMDNASAIDLLRDTSPDLEFAPQELVNELDQVRQQGFSVNLGGVESDIAAIAAPVRNSAGAVFMTVSVFGMLSRFTPDVVANAQREICSVARELETVFQGLHV